MATIAATQPYTVYTLNGVSPFHELSYRRKQRPVSAVKGEYNSVALYDENGKLCTEALLPKRSIDMPRDYALAIKTKLISTFEVDGLIIGEYSVWSEPVKLPVDEKGSVIW